MKHMKCMKRRKAAVGTWLVEGVLWIALSLLILILACPSWAATYYVSNSGSDSATGTSISTPWRTIAKVNAATAEGDTVFLNKGDVWAESLIVPAANVTVSSYGTGEKPIIFGSNILSTTTGLQPIRNPGFEQYTGTIDDGTGDKFAYYTTSGGLVEASSDVPTGSSSPVSAKLTRVSSVANLIIYVRLPANTSVTLTYDTKHVGGSGYINYVRYTDGSYHYLVTAGTWTTDASYNQFGLGSGTAWATKTFTFTTDNYTGEYAINMTPSNSEGRIQYVTNLSITWDAAVWSVYSGDTYQITTAYNPKLVLKKTGSEWIPQINGAKAGHDQDSLADGEWIYTAPNLYYRNDSAAPNTLDIALGYQSNTGSTTGCGVYTASNATVIDGIAVIGWPLTHATLTHCSGVCVNGTSGFAIQNSDVYSNDRIGMFIQAATSPTVGPVVTMGYNGGNNLTIAGACTGSHIYSSTFKWGGYWGSLDEDDGEGIGLGGGSSGATVHDNSLFRNNANTAESPNGQLVVWNSDDNEIYNNIIYDGHQLGSVLSGNGNTYHHNIVRDNCQSITGNCYAFRPLNNAAANTVGGNAVYNNDFVGGGTNYGTVFIAGTDSWQNNNFKNNIVGGSNTLKLYIDADADLTGTALDYNDYYPAATNFIRVGGTYYSTVAAYSSGQSQDAHSFSTDPRFASSSNFRLLLGSPAINAGVNVCTAEGVPFATCTGDGTGTWTDIKGSVVPHNGKISIGAYQFTSFDTEQGESAARKSWRRVFRKF